MKVLQVLPALNGGGVEKGTLEIADALVRAGHESWVLSAGGRLVSELEANGSQHKTWDIGRKSLLTLLQVRKIRRWLQENRFDIVHVRSRMPAWIIWLAWRKLPPSQRPRLVSTMHGMHSVNRYSEIMTCGERVIAVSRSIQDYILQNYPRTNPDKLRLIYRGVDAEEFPRGYRPDSNWEQTFRQDYQIPAGPPILTLPGRLTRLKGHHAFIDLISRLKQQGISVKGLIVGGEDPKRQEYAREIRSRVQELGLQDDLIFTGHRSDMKNIYALSSIVFSLSSKPESFGRTVAEALSMGVPVMGWQHGGVGEILEALFPNGAVELNNEQALLAKTLACLQGSAPNVQPNHEFLLSNMQAQTLGIYQELASHPKMN